MKKSKIKMLTASACLALIGTASAAWVYAGTATESANIGVKVASYADAGTITVTGANNVYLYLDKGSVAFKKDDETKPFTATYEKPADFSSSTKTVTLQYQVVLNINLCDTVNFKNSGDQLEYAETGRYSQWYTIESGDEILENTSLPEFAWEGTFGTFSDESAYIDFVAGLTDNDKNSPNSWYDQNKSWTLSDKYDCLINFKATVSE